MSRELGKQHGSQVIPSEIGLALVESEVVEEVKEERSNLEAEVDSLTRQLASVNRQLDRTTKRRASYEDRYRAITEHRNRAPGDFAIFKGFVFLLLAAVMLLCDLAVLGQAAATALNFTWFEQINDLGELTFPEALFHSTSGWRIALSNFPDLFFFVAGVLTIGLFLKVWFDVLESFGSTAEHGWVSVVKFVCYTVFGALSVVTIVVVATLRADASSGSTAGDLSWWPALILGIAFPLVGAGFFIRGYDNVSHGIRAWLLTTMEARHNRKVRQTQDDLDEIEVQRDIAKQQLDRVRDSDFVDTRIRRRQAKFIEGYNEGLIALFATQSGESLYEKIEPIAMKLMGSVSSEIVH